LRAHNETHFVIFNDTRSLKISVWNYQRKRSIEVTEENVCLARRYAWPPWNRNHDGGYYLGFSRNSLGPPYEHLEENSARLWATCLPDSPI